jgi:hypothetical protein
MSRRARVRGWLTLDGWITVVILIACGVLFAALVLGWV